MRRKIEVHWNGSKHEAVVLELRRDLSFGRQIQTWCPVGPKSKSRSPLRAFRRALAWVREAELREVELEVLRGLKSGPYSTGEWTPEFGALDETTKWIEREEETRRAKEEQDRIEWMRRQLDAERAATTEKEHA